jgi:hypothetical protein
MTTVNVTAATQTVTIANDGSSVVVLVPETTVVTATTVGPQGGAGAGFVFTQPSSASTWTINHNLGFKPSVDVYDSGSQQIQAEVSHASVNQTVILLTAPTAGFARLT